MNFKAIKAIREKKNFWKKLNRLGFKSYEEYLQAQHWIEIRRAFFKSGNFEHCCYACGRRKDRYEVHHKTYKRLGQERLTDLIALCGECHEQTHDLISRGVPLKRAAKRLRRKNMKHYQPDIMRLIMFNGNDDPAMIGELVEEFTQQ